VTASDEEVVNEQFVADDVPEDIEADEVFVYDDHGVYRFQRERGGSCACDLVESLDAPIADVEARDGTLYIAFYAPSMERIKAILDQLNGQYDDVFIKQLTRASDESFEDLVFVDRNKLTERQFEVLQTAVQMGYFEHPKEANAKEIADALGIASSTLSEHLAAAESKILGHVVET
jgi:predicted DNA binding protein